MPADTPSQKGPITPLDLIFGAAIWFVLAVVVTWFFFPSGGSVSDFAKAVGAGIALATAIFAPISSIVMAKYQAQLTTSLEALKREYSEEIEQIKTSLSAGLEVKKALIAGRIRAFDAMLTATHYFYYVLRQMAFSGGDSTAKLLVEADRRSAEASAAVWHLSQVDRLKWFAVYQRSIHLAGLLKIAPPEDRKGIFDNHAVALGQSIEELEAAGLATFAEADKYNLKIAEDEFRISERPLLK